MKRAEEVRDNKNATQEEVNKAFDDLKAAIDNLELFVDKTALINLINSAPKNNDGKYTEESWNKFEEAFKKAEEVRDNKNATQEEVNKAFDDLKAATQEEVNKAFDDLKAAIDNLDFKDLKEAREELNNAISYVLDLDSNLYTGDTWDAMLNILTKAQSVLLTSNDIDVIKGNTKVIEQMLKQLVKRADKTALQKLINRVIILDETLFTEETWNILQIKLHFAQEIIDNTNATQQEVDRIFELLNEAYLTLELKK